MQKKIIALAIAGLASTAAFAQSNVTMYGRMDVGFASRGGSSGDVRTNGTLNTIDSGIQSGSRLGFKGAEDLGNGLKAIFEIEANINADSSSNSSLAAGGLTSRHAYVGMTGGFGTAVAGRLDGVRYNIAGQYNAFGLGTVGQFANLQVHQTRADNAIAYISPTWSGFNVLAAYSNGLGGGVIANTVSGNGPETATGAQNLNGSTSFSAKPNQGSAPLWALKFAYNNGPISATYDHEEVNYKNVPNNNVKIDVLGGSYDFGMVKLLAYWEKINGNDHIGSAVATAGSYWDQSSYTIGATVPVMTKGLVKISYGRQNDKHDGNKFVSGTAVNLSQGDLSKWSIGFDYSLSKRTTIYTDFAKLNNKSGDGRGTMAFSGYNNSLDGGAGGYGSRGFDLGIAHNF